MIEFERKRRAIRELPLVPLIDIVFILIIFFMLTTNFMKMESMELLLPSAASKKKATVEMAHIYLQRDGQLLYGNKPMDRLDLKRALDNVFRISPDQRVVVLVAEEVSLQTLVDIMDLVYIAGGKNVFVKEWLQPPSAPEAPQEGAAGGI